MANSAAFVDHVLDLLALTGPVEARRMFGGHGLYVGTALYIAATMSLQGGYKWWIGVLAGVGVALFFFVIFEIGFKVPLLKGPVEAFFGIY